MPRPPAASPRDRRASIRRALRSCVRDPLLCLLASPPARRRTRPASSACVALLAPAVPRAASALHTPSLLRAYPLSYAPHSPPAVCPSEFATLHALRPASSSPTHIALAFPPLLTPSSIHPPRSHTILPPPCVLTIAPHPTLPPPAHPPPCPSLPSSPLLLYHPIPPSHHQPFSNHLPLQHPSPSTLPLIIPTLPHSYNPPPSLPTSTPHLPSTPSLHIPFPTPPITPPNPSSPPSPLHLPHSSHYSSHPYTYPSSLHPPSPPPITHPPHNPLTYHTPPTPSILTCPGEYALDPANQSVNVRTLL